MWYRILVHWSKDIVSLAEMMTRSRAPSVYSDREVGNSAEVGYFEPGLDYCLAGSRFLKNHVIVFLILWVLFELLKYVRDCMVVLTVFLLADLVCGFSGCGGRPVCGCVRE